MLYNSLSFLVFFVLVFAGYWLLRGNRERMALLLGASWIFYAAWYPSYLILFVAVTALTYYAGVYIGQWRETRPVAAKRLLVGAIAVDLAMLAYFKYTGFFLNVGADVAALFGAEWTPPALHIVLPLGISFYSFQSIAYIVDVYRGDVEVVRSPWKLALFKAFFPQLIAGPIVRAPELVPQFETARKADADMMRRGLDLIAIGVFKKVLIADQLAPFADQVFANPESLGSVTLLLGVYAYTLQIYCDFSGYTDIGRGCARLLGYELPLNFDHPYLSVNIVDFWRRWHMTLSRWLRDYLYIPLGGGRDGALKTYRNLLITMTLGGLWHGANWTFIVWGMYHGALLAITRFVHDRMGVKGEEPLLGGRAYRVYSIVLTFHLVCIGWVFFRAPDMATAWSVLAGIAARAPFGAADASLFEPVTLAIVAAVMLAAILIHVGSKRLGDGAAVNVTTPMAIARGAFYAAVTVGVLLFASRGAAQFIYFQF